MIDFNFTAYNEDVVIVGMKGSGKSFLANELMRGLRGINCIAFDFNHQFHDAHAVISHDVTELFMMYRKLNGGHYILQPYDKSENTFNRFCTEIFSLNNCVALIDECHQYVSKMRILKPYNDLVLSGRPRGISVISISSRPQNLPNNTLTNARHIFAFKLNLESDVKFLESWLGPPAWELLPQDQRRRNIDSPEIEEHSFYYRDTLQSGGLIGKL